MARIEPVNYEQSTGKAKELLDAVQEKLGMTPNMMTTMAQSPIVLEAYLNFSGTLSGGILPARLREEIALITAEANGCGYCAAAHTAIGQMIGLDEQTIRAAREANSSNSKDDAALKFALKLIINRGQTSEADLETIKSAGFTDGEIGEIIANVALNIFTNYFNEAIKTDVDFPAIEFPLKSRAAKV